ncbi:MAG: hypothetical protein WCO92_04600 [Verrucomicrobiota bacterium]
MKEWKHQGGIGEKAMKEALKDVRLRAIREVVAALKVRQTKRRQKRILENRTSVKVNKPGVFVVIDAAKDPSQIGGEFIVQRDRGSLVTNATEVERKSATAKDTVTLLQKLNEKNRLPLVLGSDNGPPFVAEAVVVFLEAHKVIQLRSVPHVPQHNGSAENAVGDVKGQLYDGKTKQEACRILNDNRKRKTLNWKTPTEVDQESFEPCTEELRTSFYNATKAAIKVAMLGTKSAKEKRKAEREAIFQTMEDFKLITRIRGQQQA